MSPTLLLALVGDLAQIEDSATCASLRGGPAWRGWTRTQSLLADVFDAVNVNTRVIGSWKRGHEPTFPLWPRPNATPPRPVQIADIRRQFGRH